MKKLTYFTIFSLLTLVGCTNENRNTDTGTGEQREEESLYPYRGGAVVEPSSHEEADVQDHHGP